MVLRVLRYITKASPLLLALICTGSGMHLFREVPPEVKEGTGVRAAAIFRSAVLILLFRIRLYPTSLKKLGRFMQSLIEFILAMFVVEYLQADFWLPLEVAIKKLLGKMSEVANNGIQAVRTQELVAYNSESAGEDTGQAAPGYPGESTNITDLLKDEWTVCFVVYSISTFFVISALHAAKFIDLREAKYGPEPFLYAMIQTYQKYQALTRNQRAIEERRRAAQRDRIRGYDDRDGGQKSIKGGRNGQKSIEGGRKDQKSIEGGRNDQKSTGSRNDQRSTRGGRRDQKSIGWRKDQEAIEWKKETDYEMSFDDDYSDYEMDYMDE